MSSTNADLDFISQPHLTPEMLFEELNPLEFVVEQADLLAAELQRSGKESPDIQVLQSLSQRIKDELKLKQEKVKVRMQSGGSAHGSITKAIGQVLSDSNMTDNRLSILCLTQYKKPGTTTSTNNTLTPPTHLDFMRRLGCKTNVDGHTGIPVILSGSTNDMSASEMINRQRSDNRFAREFSTRFPGLTYRVWDETGEPESDISMKTYLIISGEALEKCFSIRNVPPDKRSPVFIGSSAHSSK